MFFNNIDPVLLNFWNLEIRYYGIAYFLGFITAYLFLYYYSKKGILKLTIEKIDSLLLYLILGGVLGGRIGAILSDFAYYFANPTEMLAFWHGGMSFHGGLIGTLIALFIFTKINKINFYELADILVLPASIGLFLGRLANFTNHELYGKITNVSWCTVFKDVDNYCRHPSQLYEALKNLFIFSVLWIAKEKRKKKGFLFWIFITLYGLLRFIIEFYRERTQLILGLTWTQYACFMMFIVGSFILINNYGKDYKEKRKNRKRK